MAEEELQDARQRFQDVSDKIVALKQQVEKVADSSLRLARHVVSNPDTIQDLVKEAVDEGLRMLKDEFPPPGTADGHAARREYMARTLDVLFERSHIVLSQHTDLPEEDIIQELEGLRDNLEEFLVMTGVSRVYPFA